MVPYTDAGRPPPVCPPANHVAPLGWEHIGLTGDYVWTEANRGTAFWPLNVVYVLHAFMKKSKSGIGLPKPDRDLIEARLKRVRVLDAEERA